MHIILTKTIKNMVSRSEDSALHSTKKPSIQGTEQMRSRSTPEILELISELPC